MCSNCLFDFRYWVVLSIEFNFGFDLGYGSDSDSDLRSSLKFGLSREFGGMPWIIMPLRSLEVHSVGSRIGYIW